MKVALATCKKPPEPDHDEPILVDALRSRGVNVRVLAWDDPETAPEAGELVVLRSTWNYYADVDRFLGWVEQTSRVARLLNPAPIVATNTRKTYLRELARREIPVIPTEYVMAGEARSLHDIATAHGWRKVVIKPVVSAGSFRTQTFGENELGEGQRFLDGLTSERDAMIQRWMPSVETHGERALVWIDGQLTHAIRKAPRFAGGAESVSSVPIADDERAFAEKVLGPTASELLYARIDVVRDSSENENVLRLMELELIEPSLYLQHSSDALERLAEAIVRRARELA